MIRPPNRSLLLFAVIGALGAAYACKDISNPNDFHRTILQTSSVRNLSSGAFARLAPKVRDRLIKTNEDLAWVGRLHNEAVSDFFANRAYWTGPTKSRAADCAGIARLTLKYAEKVNVLAGIQRSPAEMRESIRAALAHTPNCGNVKPANVFVGSSPYLLATMQDSPDDVTGEFEPYLDPMSTVFQGTDGLGSLSDNVSAVEASAASIPANDYYVIAAVGSLAISSGAYWNNPGNGTGTCIERLDCLPPLQMSVFRGIYAFPWLYIGRIGAIDLLGCVAGARSSYRGGQRNWREIIGECENWGIPGSIVAAL